MIAHTLRRPGRADTVARLLHQKPLDDAILERVESDHHKAPARLEQAHGLGKYGLQRLEFLVHSDA